MAKRVGVKVPEIPRAQIMRWVGHKNLVTTNRYTLDQLQAQMGHKDPKTTQHYRTNCSKSIIRVKGYRNRGKPEIEGGRCPSKCR